MRYFYCKFALIVLFVFGLSNCYGQAVDGQIVFHNDEAAEFLHGGIYILQDSTNKLTLNDVINGPAFKPSPVAIPNLNVTSNTIWLRLTINNKSNTEKMLLEIDNPLLNNVSIYIPVGSGKYLSKTVSKALPFYHRENHSENYLFELDQRTGVTETYYLKINSYTQLIIPIKIGRVESINEGDLNRDLLRAIYFGIMLVYVLIQLLCVCERERQKLPLLYCIPFKRYTCTAKYYRSWFLNICGPTSLLLSSLVFTCSLHLRLLRQ